MKRRILSVLISAVILISTLIIPAGASNPKEALPLSAGLDALRTQFEHGVASKSGEYALDYSYYSPVGENDDGKYPLVIFLHGMGHGAYVGAELADSVMANWASQDFQQRWTDAGGAFILLPRCPEDKIEYWNKSLTGSLHTLIDEFISKYRENIDTTRIFIGGSSAGGEMAWDMAIEYPEYFAGIYPMAATGTRSTEDIKKTKDVAIWLFASTLDLFVSFSLNVQPQWEKICEYSSRPGDCRLSAFSTVKNPDGTDSDSNHRLFKTIGYDFFTVDGEPYPDVETKDGNGNKIIMESPNGMIAWMCGIHSSFEGNDPEIDSGNNILERLVAIIRNLIFKIADVFQKVFGLI